MRGMIWVVLLALAGVLSAWVSFFGIVAAIQIDFRPDTLLALLYCGMPALCLPVLLFIRPPRRAAFLLSLMALTYLGAFSVLSWRTCSELDYCQGVLATVMQTLSTNRVLAYFGVVILSLLAQLADDQSSLWQRNG